MGQIMATAVKTEMEEITAKIEGLEQKIQELEQGNPGHPRLPGLELQLAELRKEKNMLAAQGGGLAQADPHHGTASIAIFIYDPEEKPDTYQKTFRNPQRFEKFMDRGNITSLFKDGEAPGIDEFRDLVPNAIYTTAVRSIPARVRNLEAHKAHLIKRREEELARAILDDLRGEGFEAEELVEERVVKGGQGDEAETDVVVRFKDLQGSTGFVVASAKSYVTGDSDVRSLEKKVERHYAQQPRFAGHPIQLGFMTETAQAPAHTERLKATCKAKGVRLYARNGRGLSRVELRATASIRFGLR